MSFEPANLVAAFVIGSVGFVLFYYGRKQSRFLHMVTGFGLMVYPSFVSNVWLAVGIAVAVLAGLYFAVRAGW